MLDSFTTPQLETLKIVLAFVGTGASLLFGIIGTTFETHTEEKKRKDGKEITTRHPTIWLWVALIGLVISSLISGSSLLVGYKVDDRKDNEDKEYKQHQNLVSGKLVDSLTKSLSLTTEFKKSSEHMLGSLDTNVASEDKNLNKQGELLNQTQNSLFHPFYPLNMKVVVSVKLNLDSLEKISWNNIRKYFSEHKTGLNIPKQFLIATIDEGKISLGESEPFNPDDTTKYDEMFMNLNTYLYVKVLPELFFYIIEDTNTKQINSSNSLYSFSAGSNHQKSNLSLTYYIDFFEKTIIFVYSFDNPFTNFTNKSISSLYNINGGYLAIGLGKTEQPYIKLEDISMFCGTKKENFYAEFKEKNLVSQEKYMKGISKCYVKTIQAVFKDTEEHRRKNSR